MAEASRTKSADYHAGFLDALNHDRFVNTSVGLLCSYFYLFRVFQLLHFELIAEDVLLIATADSEPRVSGRGHCIRDRRGSSCGHAHPTLSVQQKVQVPCQGTRVAHIW